MRVLCGQRECPICRQENPKVVFTQTRKSFADVEHEPFSLDRKHAICFETEAVRAAYDSLLAHESPFDDGMAFTTFAKLEQHVRRQHERFYCDLCVSHLKLFTHERKCYDRVSLATHRRKGDSDDTSHRGHPLCEFCTVRFFDKDELYKHLRKDHYYCHFCDADGKQVFFK